MVVSPRSQPSLLPPLLPALLVFLLASCTAEIGAPVDHHGLDEEDLSIEITDQKVGDFERSTCSTASVAPLSRQIAAEMLCMAPGVMVELTPGQGLSFRNAAVLPFMEAEAAQHLKEAAAKRPMELTSAFRTVVQQYLIHNWRSRGRCGITAAARPGNSNHEFGRAIDVSNFSSARSELRRRGWKDRIANDRVHFEHSSSPSMQGLDVQAFQRLWNRNNPSDQVNEDGDYGSSTAARIRKAPAAGFPIGPQCAGADSEQWFGDACEDSEGCDLPFEEGTCSKWFDEDTASTQGMCIGSCTGQCPGRSGAADTFCADVDQIEGTCLPVANESTDGCADMAGTQPTTTRHFEANGTTSSTVATVCMPPQFSGIQCTSAEQTGECINTDMTTCDGEVVSGACPGANSIRCCLP